ncbi:hypothetical protein [Pseudoduganella albidiflava]|uniref:Carboxypeptidase regulatory-like domain-containing protein n=1 Tax=Pseudoduganella albidiflava TaxID=321983 RepID=A0A411WZN9_9BURK|nr:hypothetical protein [Pseudoduganella albidiflava]QBI02168.1 hypothetical protein EYF70_15895 [Pseudoduganella albidiflava]GGY60021.1 hypothetical protein GCM10007387_48210 [Pseudoduganella albidiflava]
MLELFAGARRSAARLLGAFALAGLLGAAQAHDLAPHVAIDASVPVLNATATVSDSLVTITNASPHPIAAPFTLTVGKLSAPGVAVTHPARVHRTLEVDIDVALPQGILAPGAAIAVPVRFVNPRRLPFTYQVTASGTLLTPENSVPLTVTAWRFSGDTANPRGVAAGAGVAIVVDGVVRAVTDADSQATVLVPLGQQAVAARQAPTSTGIAHLGLIAGSANSADVILAEEGEVYEEAAFRFDETVQSIIPAGAAKLTGRFIAQDGSTVRLTQLASVDAVHVPGGGRAFRLTEHFALNPDGTIRCTNLRTLGFAIGRSSTNLVVTAFDAAGNAYRARLALRTALAARTGKLVPPPSDPGLDLGGITVVGRLSLLGTYSAILTTVTNADGSFTFPAASFGQFEVSAEAQRNGRHYLAAAAAPESESQPVTLKLTSAFDLGQAPEHVAADPAASAVALDVEAADGDGASQTAALLVRQGTARVTLGYMPMVREFGGLAANGWGVRVLAGPAGTPLFDLHRQVGAQWHEFISTNSSTTTGWIERQLDVADLTRDGDIELTLQAYGVQDNAWYQPMRIAASLRSGTALTIEALTLADVSASGPAANRQVSLPAAGTANLFQRPMRIVTGKPAGAVLGNVKVQLDWGDGWDPVTVLDQAPGAGVPVDGALMHGTLTHGALIDSVLTYRAEPDQDLHAFRNPRPTQYRVTVAATAEDGTALTAERIETARWPLWRAPAHLPRYGMREPGGDDWAADRTLRWLEQNEGLLTRVDDFSGEHGLDLGHAGHADGMEFHMYHFHQFAGADAESGASNYRQLVARLRELRLQRSANAAEVALGKAAAAEVKAWIVASRAGIDRLSQADVAAVGYILGGPDSAGIAGADWGARLLTTGRVTVDGMPFDLGTGTWSNLSYFPQVNHHHHVKVTLWPDTLY